MEFRSLTSVMMAVFVLVACTKKSDKTNGNYPLQNPTSIVGGTAVAESDFAAQSTVALYIEYGSGDQTRFQQICTGTLIGRQYVLTAAHCFADIAKDAEVPIDRLARHIKVVFGLPLVNNKNDNRVRVIDIEKVIVHELYVVGSVQDAEKNPMYDIALIRMQSEAPASSVAVPILRDNTQLTKGTEVILAGFGQVDGRTRTAATELRQVNVTIEDPAFSPTQFIYYTKDTKSACSGDSGGPAYLTVDGVVHVVGVTSWGDMTCEDIGAYTSVPAFADWIDSTKTKLEPPLVAKLEPALKVFAIAI